MKKIFYILILISIIAQNQVSAQKKLPSEKPKLIITIVVEQMRYDYLTRFWDSFGQGGFKRLVNKGALCRYANYNYLLTKSAPGYATIVTGANPSAHGIISDYWYLRLQDKIQYCVDDPKYRPVGTFASDQRKSPKQLFTSTFSDELKISNLKNSKVYSVALKDYAAIIPGGRMADAAFWFDKKTGNWITSSYYTDKLPEWVNDFNSKKIPDIYLDRTWNLEANPRVYNTTLPDKNSFETGFAGQGNDFPYDLKEISKKFGYETLMYVPYGNTFTKDFALSLIFEENLGKHEYTDYLNIGFCATGGISDLFGVRSVEIQDAYIKLDKDIEHLLSTIDEFVGKENTLIILTADRGAADIPDFLDAINMEGDYFNTKSAMALLNSYLKIMLGKGEWISTYLDRQIYLNQQYIEESKLDLSKVQMQVANFLVQFAGISNAVASATFNTTNFTSGILQMAQNSYNQERSGDVLVNLKAGWAEMNPKHRNYSLSDQSTPYTYDTHVPLIFYGWKIRHLNITRKVDMTDIAPTLSYFLDIQFPNSCEGNIITELIKW